MGVAGIDPCGRAPAPAPRLRWPHRHSHPAVVHATGKRDSLVAPLLSTTSCAGVTRSESAVRTTTPHSCRQPTAKPIRRSVFWLRPATSAQGPNRAAASTPGSKP